MAHNNHIENITENISSTAPAVDATCNWYGSADYYVINPKIVGNVTFVPYLVTNDIVTPDCSGQYPPIHNLTNLYYNTIQAAINAADPGNFIKIEVASHTEGPQITVDRDINLLGLGKTSTTLYASGNTGSTGDARGWILVNTGINFNMNNLTLDGNGKQIFQGVRYVGTGNGAIDNVAFNDIKYPGYMGTAVVGFGNVTVQNSNFTQIGRIGIIFFGANCTNGKAIGNTYTGKGGGDWLDYGVEVGGGAVATITNCTITNNIGVATTDGSTSAGIIATTYYGAGTTATISGCTFTGNTTGIDVGFDGGDASVVVANNNKIYSNTHGVSSTAPTVNATSNWWGDPSGPYNDLKNTCGLGNDVSAFVDFRPWWTDIGMTTLSGPPPVPAEYLGPVPIASTVECASSAVPPTLPVVKDFCGTVLSPTGPVITGTYVGCEGTKIYTYTYTDVLLQTMTWVYTYTVDHTIAPVVPAAGASTVACASLAVPPLSGLPDQQQNLWTPSWVFYQNNSVGQSFTCGQSGKLTKIDVNVFSYTGTPTFTLEVYQGDGIVGSLLCSVPGYTVTGTGWQTLNIPAISAPTLASGTQYTFWLTGYAYNTVWAREANTNPYAGGQAWDSPPIASYPGDDLMFRTYMEPVVTDVCGIVIPTPTPVISGDYDGREGTIIYTYTYTDCASLASNWVYTYTIEREPFANPTDAVLP